MSGSQQVELTDKTRQLDEIGKLIAQYSPIGTAQAAGPGNAANLKDAFTAIVQAAETNPKYAQALALLKDGKPAEAEPLLRAAAEEMEAQARKNNKQAAEAWRSLGAIAFFSDPRRAREAYAHAISLDPDNDNVLFNLAFLEVEAGSLNAAEDHYKHLLTLPSGKTDGDPAFWAKSGLGDIAQARGKLPDALASYRASLAIAERLAKADQGNAGWQHDLSVSYNNVGDVLVAQGQLPDALASYRASLSIRERLAKEDPGNAGWERDLSVSYNKVGDVLMAQGQLPDALASYRASLAIAERLAKADPGNADWQRDLSVSYEKVGDVFVAQGQLPDALASYRADLAIAERLAKADPGNAGWQRDVAMSHGKLGLLYLQSQNMREARTHFAAGRAIMTDLVTRFPDWAQWKKDLANFDRYIARTKP